MGELLQRVLARAKLRGTSFVFSTFCCEMGMLWSGLKSLIGGKEVRLLILGLDNAGKTTILYRLKGDEEIKQTVPTVGFNVETVAFKNIKLQVWDLGGQTSIRPYWRCYYADTSGIIYVVDSSDSERVGTSGEALNSMLAEEELAGVPVCILANKQDLPGALPPEKIAEQLGLTAIKNRPWAIFKCSAVKNEGVNEGLDWIATSITGK